MPTPTKDTEPPLVDVKVTNPLTYIKRWWNRIIGNEGISFSFRVRPLTALAISIVVASLAFGVGRFVLPFTFPFFEPVPEDIVIPTPDPWRETAFTGTLQYSETTKKYYLVTTSSEAISLEVPDNIDLSGFVGRRIFAAGKYNKSTRTLVVSDARNTELLPKSPNPIPTLEPTPTPSPSPTATPEPTLVPTETPTP